MTSDEIVEKIADWLADIYVKDLSELELNVVNLLSAYLRVEKEHDSGLRIVRRKK
jgi:hypothetical protein